MSLLLKEYIRLLIEEASLTDTQDSEKENIDEFSGAAAVVGFTGPPMVTWKQTKQLQKKQAINK